MRGCMDVLYKGSKVFEAEAKERLTSVGEAAADYLGLEDVRAESDEDQAALRSAFDRRVPFVHRDAGTGKFRVDEERLAFGRPSW